MWDHFRGSTQDYCNHGHSEACCSSWKPSALGILGQSVFTEIFQLHCPNPSNFATVSLQCLLSLLLLFYNLPEFTLTSLTSVLLQRHLQQQDLKFAFNHGNVFGCAVTWCSARRSSWVKSNITCNIKNTEPNWVPHDAPSKVLLVFDKRYQAADSRILHLSAEFMIIAHITDFPLAVVMIVT